MPTTPGAPLDQEPSNAASAAAVAAAAATGIAQRRSQQPAPSPHGPDQLQSQQDQSQGPRSQRLTSPFMTPTKGTMGDSQSQSQLAQQEAAQHSHQAMAAAQAQAQAQAQVDAMAQADAAAAAAATAATAGWDPMSFTFYGGQSSSEAGSQGPMASGIQPSHPHGHAPQGEAQPHGMDLSQRLPQTQQHHPQHQAASSHHRAHSLHQHPHPDPHSHLGPAPPGFFQQAPIQRPPVSPQMRRGASDGAAVLSGHGFGHIPDVDRATAAAAVSAATGLPSRNILDEVFKAGFEAALKQSGAAGNGDGGPGAATPRGPQSQPMATTPQQAQAQAQAQPQTQQQQLSSPLGGLANFANISMLTDGPNGGAGVGPEVDAAAATVAAAAAAAAAATATGAPLPQHSGGNGQESFSSHTRASTSVSSSASAPAHSPFAPPTAGDAAMMRGHRVVRSLGQIAPGPGGFLRFNGPLSPLEGAGAPSDRFGGFGPQRGGPVFGAAAMANVRPLSPTPGRFTRTHLQTHRRTGGGSSSGAAAGDSSFSSADTSFDSTSATTCASTAPSRASSASSEMRPSFSMQSSVASSSSRGKKSKLLNIDRKRICEFARDNPKLKQEEIAVEFQIERSTVSKILKQKDKWLAIDEEAAEATIAKHRAAKFPELEERLTVWAVLARNENRLLTDMAIKHKALELAKELNLGSDRFKASGGWIEKFRERHGIAKPVVGGGGIDEADWQARRLGGPGGVLGPHGEPMQSLGSFGPYPPPGASQLLPHQLYSQPLVRAPSQHPMQTPPPPPGASMPPSQSAPMALSASAPMVAVPPQAHIALTPRAQKRQYDALGIDTSSAMPSVLMQPGSAQRFGPAGGAMHGLGPGGPPIAPAHQGMHMDVDGDASMINTAKRRRAHSDRFEFGAGHDGTEHDVTVQSDLTRSETFRRIRSDGEHTHGQGMQHPHSAHPSPTPGQPQPLTAPPTWLRHEGRDDSPGMAPGSPARSVGRASSVHASPSRRRGGHMSTGRSTPAAHSDGELGQHGSSGPSSSTGPSSGLNVSRASATPSIGAVTVDEAQRSLEVVLQFLSEQREGFCHNGHYLVLGHLQGALSNITDNMRASER